jgi:predicted nuclease of restriction endonuclease-like (RecB) superfamily
LSWTHFKPIIYLNDPLQREFYAEMCRIERWSTRTLQAKINGMLYERTVLSRKPAELARQELKALREEEKLSPDLVFRGFGRARNIELQFLRSETGLSGLVLPTTGG